MKLCDFKEEASALSSKGSRKKYRCTRCHRCTPWLRAEVTTVYRPCTRKSAGLGERVGWLLSLIGITKARWFGGCGGCGDRAAKLDAVGWELSDRWRAFSKQLLSIWQAVKKRCISVH